MIIGMSHLPDSLGVPLAEVELEPPAAHCGIGHEGLLTADELGVSTSLATSTSWNKKEKFQSKVLCE